MKSRVDFSSFKITSAFVCFLVLFILLPFWRLFFSLLSHFHFEELSSDFLFLIAKSFFWTGLHAAVTSILLLVLAGALALLLAASPLPKFFQIFIRFLQGFGDFVFFMPSLSAALYVLWLSQKLPFIQAEGIYAIILAHFSINFFYIFGKFWSRTQLYLSGEGLSRLQSAWLLGVDRFSLFRIFWKPLALSEMRSWGGPLFWWCFSNFSSILVLGGVRLSNPELLLYFNIQSGSSESRLFLLVLFQIISGLALGFFLNKNALDSQSAFGAISSPLPLPPQKKKPILNYILFSILGALFVPQGFFFGNSFVSIFKTPLPESLVQGLPVTLLFAVTSTSLCFLFCFIFCLSSQSLRKFMSWGMGLSSAILCFSLLQIDNLQRILNNEGVSFVLLCLIFSALKLPLFALWANPRIESIPLQQKQSAWTLGLSSFGYFRNIFWPQNKELFFRISLFCFVSSLGEILLTSLLLPDQVFLATLARRLGSRYSFNEADWIVVIYSLCVLGALALRALSERKKEPLCG